MFAREVAEHCKRIFDSHCEPVAVAANNGIEGDEDLIHIDEEKKTKKIDDLVRKDAPSKAYRMATDTSTSKPFDPEAVQGCRDMFHSAEPESVLEPPTQAQFAAFNADFTEACTVVSGHTVKCTFKIKHFKGADQRDPVRVVIQ